MGFGRLDCMAWAVWDDAPAKKKGNPWRSRMQILRWAANARCTAVGRFSKLA